MGLAARSLAFSPNGAHLAVGTHSGSIRVVQVRGRSEGEGEVGREGRAGGEEREGEGETGGAGGGGRSSRFGGGVREFRGKGRRGRDCLWGIHRARAGVEGSQGFSGVGALVGLCSEGTRWRNAVRR